MANTQGAKLFLHKYRLLWIEDSGSWRREVRLPLWGWLLLLGASAVVIWSIFAYTPLRYTIPGYPTRRFREKYAELIQRARQLEQKMNQYTLLIEELRTLSQVMREETGTGSAIPLLATVHSGEYILPLEGAVSRRIQPAKGHWGIDITSPAGAPVLAIAEGTVVLAEYSYESGYIIGIQHPNGLLSLYKHNSRLMRQVGEKVRAGDIIALAGGLGAYSSGPHLHIETWMGGQVIDPLKLLSYE